VAGRPEGDVVVSGRRLLVVGYWHESSSDRALLDGPVGRDHFTLNPPAAAAAVSATCERLGIEVVRGVVAVGYPSAVASDDVYLDLRDEIIASVRAAGAVDAVFLAIHGAAATTTIDDVEGDLAAAVRAEVGSDVPIVATLDLHALVTPAMAESIDVMLGCHTYPHVDLDERAVEAIELLPRLWAGLRPVTHVEHVPISMPMTATALAPMPTIASRCAAVEAQPGVIDCTFFHGYAYTDSTVLGASVVAITDGDASLAADAAGAVAADVWALRHQLRPPTLTPDEAVKAALDLDTNGPVVIADSADNPGAGTTGDNTYLLRALLDTDAPASCIGYFCAPDVVAAAHAAGAGAHIDAVLGGRQPDLLGPPVAVTTEVVAVTDGRYTVSSPMQAGASVSYGPGARLRAGNVDIVCCSRPHQVLDGEGFALVGIDVSQQRIVAVKSRQHFRAGFADAGAVLVADGGGLSTYRVENLPRNKRPSPLFPFDEFDR
jgi:microcystin degradation protein MlrC